MASQWEGGRGLWQANRKREETYEKPSGEEKRQAGEEEVQKNAIIIHGSWQKAVRR